MKIKVPASDNNKDYDVVLSKDRATCECMDFMVRRKRGLLGPCKHIREVLAALEIAHHAFRHQAGGTK